MYSIRTRLNQTIILGMVVMLALSAVSLYWLIAKRVEEVFDGALHDKAQAMISMTEMESDASIEFDFAEEGTMTEFVEGENLQYYQLWSESGDEILKSPSLGEVELPRKGIEPGEHRFADLDLADGRAGRLIEVSFLPRIEQEDAVWEASEIGDDEWAPEPLPEAKPVLMVLARERESLNESLLAIAMIIGGVSLAMIGLSALVIYRLVGAGLQPLARFARQVAEIDESQLDRRIGEDDGQNLEISPIAQQINHLLERLHSAFEREKRFSSNVAHELRTPLSELRTLAEVGEMLPEDREKTVQFFTDVGEISKQMEKVVITLLELARSDAGLLRSDPEDIQLAPFCEWIWGQVVNGKNRDKRLLREIPEDLVINTDREKLGMILNNLFVNAVSYSPLDAVIEISALIRNNMVVLEVRNMATDLKPEDIVHMRDRFWRKQKSPDGYGHSGLGLSLVDALARIMNLDVDLQLDQRQIFMVSISGIRPVAGN